MSATLSYDLKKALFVLTKEHRWDVLTVLILHANIRNRCWVSTDTICEMATNGNRNKAIAAKKWLEKHKTLEIVTYNKRVDEEKKLKPRQHVYQLLGQIRKCEDALCDCQKLSEIVNYLYINSMDGETFKSMDGETFKSMDGETRSIPIEQKPIKENTILASDDAPPESQLIVNLIKAYLDASGTIKPAMYGNKTIRAEAKELVAQGITPLHISTYIQRLRLDEFWKNKEVKWAKVCGEIIVHFKDNPLVEKIHESPPQYSTTPPPVTKLSPTAARREAEFQEWVKKGKPAYDEELG